MASRLTHARVAVQQAEQMLKSARHGVASWEGHLADRRRELADAEREEAARVPVDRGAQVLTSGAPVPEDGSHARLRPDGQQEGYVVLTEDERKKGFVRPYRDAYRHITCGGITTMVRALADTYARDPAFYSGTYCSTCHAHFKVGAEGEFTWYEMDGSEGPRVGT